MRTSTSSQSPAGTRLHHLTVFSSLYAETDGGRFHARRTDRRHMWYLIDRDGHFPPHTCHTVEECDARLAGWLATQ
jgi:hypothetical protein